MAAMAADAPRHTFKVVVNGAGGAGKSVLLRRLSGKAFRRGYVPTVGAEIVRVNYQVRHGNDAFDIQVDFWDTAGVEANKGLVGGYYIQRHDVLTVVDARNVTEEVKWNLRFSTGGIAPLIVANTFDDEANADLDALRAAAREGDALYAAAGLGHELYALCVRTASREDLLRPVLALLRRLTRMGDLELVKVAAG